MGVGMLNESPCIFMLKYTFIYTIAVIHGYDWQ